MQTKQGATLEHLDAMENLEIADSVRQIVMGLSSEENKCWASCIYVTDTMVGALHTFYHLILTVIVQERHYDSQFQFQGNWCSEMLDKNTIVKQSYQDSNPGLPDPKDHITNENV